MQTQIIHLIHLLTTRKSSRKRHIFILAHERLRARGAEHTRTQSEKRDAVREYEAELGDADEGGEEEDVDLGDVSGRFGDTFEVWKEMGLIERDGSE